MIVRILATIGIAAVALVPSVAQSQTAPDTGTTLGIRFEPSGTHVDSKGNLKVRLDFYPDASDKSYEQQHVFVVDETSPEFLAGYKGPVDKDGNPADPIEYQKWLDSLPHIWRVNPALCLFVVVPMDITKETLDVWVKATFTSNVTATIDDAMSQPNSAHLISPYMAGKSAMTTEKVAPTEDKAALIEAVKARLTGYSVDSGTRIGEVQPIQPRSITVGSAAIDRGLNSALWTPSGGGIVFTWIDYNLAANAAGTITTVEAWFSSALAGNNVRFGSFADGGAAVFTCNDGENIGSVTSGSKQTYNGLTIAINAGEYLGSDGLGSTGGVAIERDTSGFTNAYHYQGAGDCDPGDSHTYTANAADALSLYGTGTESGGWTTIAKVNGVASASIGKVNGVAKASIGKLNGVTP